MFGQVTHTGTQAGTQTHDYNERLSLLTIDYNYGRGVRDLITIDSWYSATKQTGCAPVLQLCYMHKFMHLIISQSTRKTRGETLLFCGVCSH